MHKCAVCGFPVIDDDAHFPHEPGCPNGYENEFYDSGCACDYATHAECCWTCEE